MREPIESGRRLRGMSNLAGTGGLLVALSVSLAACSAPETVAVESYAPNKVLEGSIVYTDDRRDLPLAAGSLDDTGRLLITMYGSSSCPDIPTDLQQITSGKINIRFEELGAGGCTADLAPLTHVFELPEQVRTNTPLEVEIESPTVREVSGEADMVLMLRVPPVSDANNSM